MHFALSKNSSSSLRNFCMMVFNTTDSELKDVKNMLNNVCDALEDMAKQVKRY